MKQILILDESPLSREYLRRKLEDNGIEVSVAFNAIDGAAKMRNFPPDLIIMDYHLSRQGIAEVFKQKKNDPNTVNIPVIILAQSIDQNQLIEMVPYNVKKVFTKPLKIDTLFATLSELLGIPFNIDESPGTVEVHVNDNIIFIEISQGLNRDKMDLLHFKIIELIDLYEIKIPKVIIMLSNIKLSFADAPNMQKLLDTIVKASRTKLRFIRVLTMDEFVSQFIKGQKEYAAIEVVSNLQFAMDDLLSKIDNDMNQTERKTEFIGDKILKAQSREDTEAMAFKFEAEARNARMDLMKDSLKNLRIAVIDDDVIIQGLIENTFRKTGAAVSAYSDGEEFLAVVGAEEFDLVFLDINMPKVDGIQVLKVLQDRKINYPVIVLSVISQREIMIKAIQMGVKSYLVKPLKPDAIFKKSIEILKANF